MSDVDYDSQTVEELREEAEARNLSTSGRKADLVARLELDDAEGAEGDDGTTVESTQSAPTGGQDKAPDRNQAAQVDPDAEPGQAPGATEGEPIRGTVPSPTVTGQGGVTTQGSFGVPAQMRAENQDASVKGKVTNERGVVIREEGSDAEGDSEQVTDEQGNVVREDQA